MKKERVGREWKEVDLTDRSVGPPALGQAVCEAVCILMGPNESLPGGHADCSYSQYTTVMHGSHVLCWGRGD